MIAAPLPPSPRLLAAALSLLAAACTSAPPTSGDSSSGASTAAADTSAPSPAAAADTSAPSADTPAPNANTAAPSADTPSPSASADTPSPSASADTPSSSAAANTPSPSAVPAPSGPCPAGMQHIPGGTYTRHKPGRQRSVTIRSFCLDRTEVTVLAYKQCVREKKCSPRCLEVGRCTAVPTDAEWPDAMETIRASMFCNGSRTDRDAHPVNCVSFDEAKGFCAARGKRIPTGDEWEWAVVGDKAAPIFPWGQHAPHGTDLCWGEPYKRSLTCIPGSFPPDTTRDGVVDMTGNLSEWVLDTFVTPPRPQLRGSSWYAIDDGYVQASLWGFESTSGRSEVFGFRCAKDS
ncbi:MAG: SUMF1/EgtB/PvdO family nonheme iron enzyme [Polyangiaceae bacterium]